MLQPLAQVVVAAHAVGVILHGQHFGHDPCFLRFVLLELRIPPLLGLECPLTLRALLAIARDQSLHLTDAFGFIFDGSVDQPNPQHDRFASGEFAVLFAPIDLAAQRQCAGITGVVVQLGRVAQEVARFLFEFLAAAIGQRFRSRRQCRFRVCWCCRWAGGLCQRIDKRRLALPGRHPERQHKHGCDRHTEVNRLDLHEAVRMSGSGQRLADPDCGSAVMPQ